MISGTCWMQYAIFIAIFLSGPRLTRSSSSNNNGDLIINVGYTSSNEEEPTSIYRQVISGNSSTDTVVIEFSEPDGTLVTQLTDFRMQSQIMRIIIPGEEELGQPLFQVLCFVSFFNGDLIPPEAVMKLRQKRPGALRTAEDDQGDVIQESPLSITPNLPKLTFISSHLSSLCKDARTTSYTSAHDLQSILSAANNQGDRLGNNIKPSLGSLTNRIQGYDNLPFCSNLSTNDNSDADNNIDDEEQDEDNEAIKDKQCRCSRKVWLNWYPCALKYCQNKDGEGEHRCGIRTCKKGIHFHWPTSSRFCIDMQTEDEM